MNDSPRSFRPVAGNVMPRFSGIATFMRLPHVTDLAEVDIGLIGVPWDGGTTNRAGARHGPRQIRDMSTMMRNVHFPLGIRPFELANCADLGDVACNPIDLDDTLKRVEAFFARVHAAGVIPLAAGGDHLLTLPIMRAIARDRPVGMVHFDAHTDTFDRYFGDYTYTHGTPFRRAIEEGLLDPRRTVQIGIRGARPRPRRRRRGRGGAALRPERQHRPRRRHHDVRDPLSAGRAGGEASGLGLRP